jgi:uncharacterized membrane protein
LVLLNNFLHDFSAAGWLFGSVILWSLLRKEIDSDSNGLLLADVLKTVLFLMRISVVGIVVFGVVRTLAYKTYEWNAAAGQSQITLLIIKHVFLAGIFGWGLFYYIRARTLVRKALNEKTK